MLFVMQGRSYSITDGVESHMSELKLAQRGC